MDQTQRAFADELILGELFDLCLYKELHKTCSGPLQGLLSELIPVEERHYAFWRKFFNKEDAALGLGQRVKLSLILGACRLLGPTAVHLVLEATEVYGIRKYLAVWQQYQDQPLGQAVKEILQDEFGHEDDIVSQLTERKISPERVRNIFFGLNDGSVEVLGALSGFFAAFHRPELVLMAGSSVAVAGALSMAAGAYAATSSEAEVRRIERGKARFLGRQPGAGEPAAGPLQAAGVIGASYFLGAMIPVTPVILGATTVLYPLMSAGLAISAISLVLAYLSGMAVRKRILMNLGMMAGAVAITYLVGGLAQSLWGISL
jgi:VIT1/CCC1 family predicted Fe2+/Mn2+ transporter